jgi:predicted transcriptional regulator
MSKTQILEVINNLPAEVDLDDLLNKLYVLEKIERGERQIDAGECVSHEEAKKRLGL